MKKPVRLHLSRKKGFNLQALSRATNGREAVNVARPGKLGNPFIVGKHGTRAECVEWHRKLATRLIYTSIDYECTDAQREHLTFVRENSERFRGRNVACWCKGEPCHGDTLLEVFNRRVRK
jgi:hypothetical protein